MKKILLTILSIMLVLCLAFAYGCGNKELGVPKLPNGEEQVLTLSTGTKTLVVGESFTLKVSGVNETTIEFDI